MQELGAAVVGLVVERIGRARAEWPAEPACCLLPVALVERDSVRAVL